MSHEFVLQVLLALASGAGAYGAIRADLARLHERVEAQRQRIDDMHKKGMGCQS